MLKSGVTGLNDSAMHSHKPSQAICQRTGSKARTVPSIRSYKRRDSIILIQWIKDNAKNPYPTDEEKVILAKLSRRTLRQLNTWFTNTRRVIKKTSMEEWLLKHPVPPLSSPLQQDSIGQFLAIASEKADF